MISATRDGFKKIVKGDGEYPRVTIEGSYATIVLSPEPDDAAVMHRDELHDLLGVLSTAVDEMDKCAAFAPETNDEDED